jgi:hypothetical protein
MPEQTRPPRRRSGARAAWLGEQPERLCRGTSVPLRARKRNGRAESTEGTRRNRYAAPAGAEGTDVPRSKSDAVRADRWTRYAAWRSQTRHRRAASMEGRRRNRYAALGRSGQGTDMPWDKCAAVRAGRRNKCAAARVESGTDMPRAGRRRGTDTPPLRRAAAPPPKPSPTLRAGEGYELRGEGMREQMRRFPQSRLRRRGFRAGEGRALTPSSAPSRPVPSSSAPA